MNPTRQRQRVISFPTPNVNDYLFFETVDAQRIGSEKTAIPEYGSKHPDTIKWPNHRLVHVEPADEELNFYKYYYAADQLDQDEDNWAFTKADIGGTKFDAVTRDYVIRRTEFDADTPAMAATMPNTPSDKFSGTYVLAEREQRPIDNKVLNGLYVIERRTYVKKVPLTRLDFDEFFNTSNYTTQTLLHKDEFGPDTSTSIEDLVANAGGAFDSYWEVSAYGVLRTAEQLSDQWYVLNEREVVNTGGTGTTTITLNQSMNYRWPPVLDDVVFDTWNLRSGGVRSYPRVTYTRGPYSGPCSATVARTWTKAKPLSAGDTDPTMQPEPISFTTPYFRVNVPPTLHADRNFVGTNGTEDETYEYTIWAYNKGATNYTDWPSSLVVSSSARPFRGGWLLEEVTVFKPETTVV